VGPDEHRDLAPAVFQERMNEQPLTQEAQMTQKIASVKFAQTKILMESAFANFCAFGVICVERSRN
jgi:hypothetical protein